MWECLSKGQSPTGALRATPSDRTAWRAPCPTVPSHSRQRWPSPALLSPVSAVPVQAKPDTILGLRPVARGAMFPFERPAELLFTQTADLGEVMFGLDDAGTLDR